MPSSIVTLGGVTLRGHEVPEKINFGGKQTLVKHRLVGGRRVTDAMGPDSTNPKWEGRFRGDDALSRARRVDQMRKRGAQIPLSWGGLYFTVIIEEFEADYRRVFDLPYRIEVYITDEEGTGRGSSLPGIDALIGGDLGTLIGLAGSLITNPVGTAIGQLSSSISSLPSLVSAPIGAISPIQNTAAQTVNSIQDQVVETDRLLDETITPDASLLPGPAFAQMLLSQSDLMVEQDVLLRSRGLAGRVETNLKSIPG